MLMQSSNVLPLSLPALTLFLHFSSLFSSPSVPHSPSSYLFLPPLLPISMTKPRYPNGEKDLGFHSKKTTSKSGKCSLDISSLDWGGRGRERQNRQITGPRHRVCQEQRGERTDDNRRYARGRIEAGGGKGKKERRGEVERWKMEW